MPMSKLKPEVKSRTFQGKISAAFALALLLVPAALADDTKDRN